MVSASLASLDQASAVRSRDAAEAAGALASGRRVILAEADALRRLAETIGDSFAEVVGLLAGVTGRVCVTGMGKSGHVARKIAATMASTGTPALYVHPGEASHGDLGMITPQDAVIALSNSGETIELRDLILYTRRFSIPLVAVVGRAGSTLAEAADHCLVLPQVGEACPMGLAPTTSTTCMLALGDALAVALLERRGFSARDFAVFHPGGKLGSQLLRVEQLMHKGEELPLVEPGTRLSDTVLEMTRKRLGCVGVVEAGRLVGIITDGDLRRHMAPDMFDRTAGEIMTPNPRTIDSRALAVEAVAVMNGPPRPVTVLFVVEDGRPVGALHLHDCLKVGIA
ncbi:KpsF/GutQ family sugar-phosphate isomerase [Benzoatithermus flavus]|uniref:KpsF/GutQ family sugar-phosphate isomerase n=1 Tax=Benzoatithermus flavus TaxID=3108223 RepID=A0ABU8XLI7_9PROT